MKRSPVTKAEATQLERAVRRDPIDLTVALMSPGLYHRGLNVSYVGDEKLPAKPAESDSRKVDAERTDQTRSMPRY